MVPWLLPERAVSRPTGGEPLANLAQAVTSAVERAHFWGGRRRVILCRRASCDVPFRHFVVIPTDAPPPALRGEPPC